MASFLGLQRTPDKLSAVESKVVQGTRHYIAMWWASRQPCSDDMVTLLGQVPLHPTLFWDTLGHMAWYRSLKSKCMCLIHSLKLFFSHGHLPTSITVCYRPLPFGYHVKQENDPRRFSPAKQIILRMFSVDLRLGGMQAIHRNF